MGAGQAGPAAGRVHLARTERVFRSPGAAPGGRESQSAFLFNYLHLPLGADILGSGGSVTSTRGPLDFRLVSLLPRAPFSRPLGSPSPPPALIPVSRPFPITGSWRSRDGAIFGEGRKGVEPRVTPGAMQIAGNRRPARRPAPRVCTGGS